MFEAERGSLVHYVGPFDGFHCVPASVTKTCTVRIDNNKYSVLSTAVGRPVEVHAYADRIIVKQDGAVVAEHRRSFGRGETNYLREVNSAPNFFSNESFQASFSSPQQVRTSNPCL